MNEKNKKIFPITIGTIVLLFFAIIAFIIYPNVRDIISINNKTRNERMELEKKLAQGLNIGQIKKDLVEIQSSLGGLDDILIKQTQELEFVTKIEAIAAADGVSLNINSDFTGQKIGDRLKQIPLQINVSGNYNNMIKFLADIETLPYYYNINLITASGKQGLGDLTIQFIGQTFMRETANKNNQ